MSNNFTRRIFGKLLPLSVRTQNNNNLVPETVPYENWDANQQANLNESSQFNASEASASPENYQTIAEGYANEVPQVVSIPVRQEDSSLETSAIQETSVKRGIRSSAIHKVNSRTTTAVIKQPAARAQTIPVKDGETEDGSSWSDFIPVRQEVETSLGMAEG